MATGRMGDWEDCTSVITPTRHHGLASRQCRCGMLAYCAEAGVACQRCGETIRELEGQAGPPITHALTVWDLANLAECTTE